jgi:hypothetical protein
MKKWEYKVLKVEKKGEINAFGDYVKETIHYEFKDLGEDSIYETGTSSFEIFNKLGAQGWELVNSTEYINSGETMAVNYNFKREVV